MSCPICYQQLNLPIKLECCGNLIDYLCIKTILLSNTVSHNCPMCRAKLSDDILENIDSSKLAANNINNNCLNQWFFAGRQWGWWKYDPISNKEIDNQYQKYLSNNTDKIFQITISPKINIEINYENMTQKNLSTGVIRNIKKESCYQKSMDSKGIAGIKTHNIHN